MRAMRDFSGVVKSLSMAHRALSTWQAASAKSRSAHRCTLCTKSSLDEVLSRDQLRQYLKPLSASIWPEVLHICLVACEPSLRLEGYRRRACTAKLCPSTLKLS
jgi:hypothetical protein